MIDLNPECWYVSIGYYYKDELKEMHKTLKFSTYKKCVKYFNSLTPLTTDDSVVVIYLEMKEYET